MTDDKLEKVPLEKIGVPCPGANEWPEAGNVKCDTGGCKLPCVAVEIEKGSNLATYICRNEHLTPILASLAGEESQLRWRFERSPF